LIEEASSASARQRTGSHQELVNVASALPALADGPDHQRLAAPHIAGGEDLVDGGAIVVGARAYITARVQLPLLKVRV
jgi:hypothetical protein